MPDDVFFIKKDEGVNPLSVPHSTLLVSVLLVGLASFAWGFNYFVFKFEGNVYYPSSTWILASILVFMLWGNRLLFGKNSVMVEISQELLCYFLIMLIIAYASNSIQFTPFQPIDPILIKFERALAIYEDHILAWTLTHPVLQGLLVALYDSLPYQMTLIPIGLIVFRQKTLLWEYFFLILLTALIGFSFYYFFPTLAPASYLESTFFSEAQHATGLKFREIHTYLRPSTNEGGLIALPSFHSIWAWLCTYTMRKWRYIFVPLLICNLGLMSACVLLGWHYLIDLLGSFFVLLIAHFAYRHLHGLRKAEPYHS